ncbi:glycoside hydrolase superfamily [Neurospora crassa]|nr:glycoside hydrolase superfamily [Neurospora crassa]
MPPPRDSSPERDYRPRRQSAQRRSRNSSAVRNSDDNGERGERAGREPRRRSRRPEPGTSVPPITRGEHRGESSNGSSATLSAAALAQLNKQNAKRKASPKKEVKRALERSYDAQSERDVAWEREQERERERMREARRESRMRREKEREREQQEKERERERERVRERERERDRERERQRGRAKPPRVATVESEDEYRYAPSGKPRDSRDAARDDRTRPKPRMVPPDSDDEYQYLTAKKREERARKRAPAMESDDEYQRLTPHRRTDSDDKGYRVVDARPDKPKSYERLRPDNRAGEDRSRLRVASGPMLEQGIRARNVSGGMLEKGGFMARFQNLRGGHGGPSMSSSSGYESVDKMSDDIGSSPPKRKRKKLWIAVGIGVVIVIIIIIIAVTVSKKKSDDGDGKGSNDTPSQGLGDISPDDIPADAPAWLNPFKWADTTDFNLTYTAQTVGDLPVMGLFSQWDDSKAANDQVPALNKPWGDYSKRPARGVNVGGWLSLEPFITPSLFAYDLRLGIVDEYTLCTHLGSRCESVFEKHYATFVTEQTFKEIADAGLDHVRIPFSYWAVQTYDGDPYVFRTSWRYLLRAIEWCRKYGLRVNLDLHGLPGSQNGWNHSGRQGYIGWLNGTDGDLNAKRSLEIHDRLSKFFAQDRYKNIISHYGLANEPKMTFLSVDAVLQWIEDAYALVRKNGVKDAIVVFGDGFRGLANWQGELQDLGDGAALDVHQYVIFNTNQIVYKHHDKIKYACEGWTEQTELSMDRSRGYGPTLVAEWSQADTDCAKYLTNVGWGNRWTGTLLTGSESSDVSTPRCPYTDSRCDCIAANAPPDQWSDDYKTFLKMFAEAQMYSFEKGWGWFYWLWDTEDAYQWSYKKGLAAGVLPEKAYQRDFNCDVSKIPSFDNLSEAF